MRIHTGEKASKISNMTLAILSSYAYSKLSKELKNGISILSRPSGSRVIDQNIMLTILIHNLKTA